MTDFLQLVYRMRQQQKAYFKYRNTTELKRSIALELQVDEAIRRIKDQQLEEKVEKQKTLFDLHL
ncbi:MAG: hypothetical protein WKF85_14330 [Chitinophagaceae bacterium]